MYRQGTGLPLSRSERKKIISFTCGTLSVRGMNPLRNKRGNMIYYVSDNERVSSPVARIRLDVKHGELGGEITTGRGDILPITGSVMSGYEQLIITSDRFIS